ncbi:hypothetical protein BOTBODRAFT_151371 [Botryobasidium botryosum FD-172 SS1]|uniref:Fatty acid hydroxylase domain-containing protein n=1 Tax=Botryobasidium botryosum (strain FD-172 SS1) TaxID=930990 RepID=A0A067MXX0_BOTB1|nr:hypothetical protein BOTBODRAFT_151371 [Botryobasidium botryosum FD-172 SS1]
MNSTDSIILSSLVPEGPLSYPFYYSPNPTLLPFVTDKTLSIFLPIICYWVFSFFFVFLDRTSHPWLVARRIHESEEVKSRNLASPLNVALTVLFQQALQIAVSLVAVKDDDKPIWPSDHRIGMGLVAPYVMKAVFLILGRSVGTSLLSAYGKAMVYHTYWYVIPVAQYLLGIVVMDTWQYWIHRLFHVNHFLFEHFHQVHHRLRVPYAYGALYAHPFEALVLEIFGAALAFEVPRMTTRQGTALFVFSTCKAVDDHCGYSFTYDPFQLFFGDKALFHDLHHQVAGMKYNYSQPFFNIWDRLCGTYRAPKPLPKDLPQKTE